MAEITSGAALNRQPVTFGLIGMVVSALVVLCPCALAGFHIVERISKLEYQQAAVDKALSERSASLKSMADNIAQIKTDLAVLCAAVAAAADNARKTGR